MKEQILLGGIETSKRRDYLKQRIDDIKFFNEKSRVRLVIGIYNEPAGVAYTDKNMMKDLMVEFAGILFEKGVFVEFATHETEQLGAVVRVTSASGNRMRTDKSWNVDEVRADRRFYATDVCEQQARSMTINGRMPGDHL